MITRRTCAIGAATVAALVASGCTERSLPYHYKLTVEVETPEGLRSGSSVMAVRMPNYLKGTEALGGSGPSARGEAVAVDLPNGKVLFALLPSDADVDWAGTVHMKSTGRKQDDFPDKKKFRERLRNSRETFPVTRWVEQWGGEKVDNYPIMVTFEDIKDPKSVKRVNPDDLVASFGAGYKLKAITVLGTDQPVTTGLEKRLGWLSKYPEPRLDPDYKGSKKPNLAQSLWHGYFSSGVR
jgi:hypothetical protein